MGKIYGYARVSSKDQNEARQVLQLLEAGIPRKNIYRDKMSGKDFNRPAYQALVHRKMKKGDLLVVASIDRLGRNYEEILREWSYITRQLECDIQILDMPLLNTGTDRDLLGTLISDIVLQLLSYVAENERKNIRQRQAEGIAAAKRSGVKFGRPRRKLPENFESICRQWRLKAISTDCACQQAGLPRYTFYRCARQLQASQAPAPPPQEDCAN